MELYTAHIEKEISEEELQELKDYFERNKPGILKELEKVKEHIDVRPVGIIFGEHAEKLKSKYQQLAFSKSKISSGETVIYVELIK